MAIGNTLSLCERMKGIRIVDTVAKNAYRCRFELWMNYNQENLDQLKIDS